MSISSPEPMNEETREKAKKLFGDPVAHDNKTILLNNMPSGSEFRDLEKGSEQILDMHTFEIGDIKTLEDGTQYQVTVNGWVKIEPTVENEVKEAHQFLDKNIFSFDKILELAELRKLLLWTDEGLTNGGPLHIIVEDGNYDDSDIDFCSLAISDKYWRENVPAEDLKTCKRIIELLRPLTPEQREMVGEGTVITDELHNLLYNQCAQGG